MQDSRTDPPAEADRRDHVGSLAKGLHVMEVLARAPESLTLTEVADAAGMSRATARRFLLTLVDLGYAARTGKRFALTARLLAVAGSRLGMGLLWHLAEPHLRAVSRTLNESCSAAILDGPDVVYVARAAANRVMSVNLTVGSRLPAHCTSMGRAILAFLEQAEREAALSALNLARHTPHTITDRSALAAELDRIAAAGHAVVDQELEIGLRSIAVPVRHADGRAMAALNVSTHAGRVSVEEMTGRFLPPLREAAGRIAALARSLGG